jgi:hypothetical protein
MGRCPGPYKTVPVQLEIENVLPYKIIERTPEAANEALAFIGGQRFSRVFQYPVEAEIRTWRAPPPSCKQSLAHDQSTLELFHEICELERLANETADLWCVHCARNHFLAVTAGQ